MKVVTLKGPAIVAGALRYPVEGAQTVTDKEAERLKDGGFLEGEPEDVPEEEDAPEPKPQRGKKQEA